MARPKRGKGELQESSNHLFYEIWMLESVARGLSSGIAGQGPLHNALVESFVIHLRAVMDFLYADKPRIDDVVAEDYSDNPAEWVMNRPPLSKLLTNAKQRAGKEVAHLTYARLLVKTDDKSWEFMQIIEEIRAGYTIFFARVSKDMLGSSWRRTIEELKQGQGIVHSD